MKPAEDRTSGLEDREPMQKYTRLGKKCKNTRKELTGKCGTLRKDQTTIGIDEREESKVNGIDRASQRP